MTNIRIRDQELIPRLKEGASVVAIPLKEQPHTVITTGWSETNHFYIEDKRMGYILPPCQPGNKLFFCEMWGYYPFAPNKYIYKADDNADLRFLRVTIKWRSPATMPNAACRFVFTCTSIEAVQAKDISPVTMVGLGMGYDIATGDLPEDYADIMLINCFNDWFTTTYNLSPEDWLWLIGIKEVE